MKHVFRRFTGEFRAQIFIGRDVKHPRLRTVGNRRPILAAPQAWTELGGLVGAGFARLVDVRPPCLRVANAGIAASRVPELSKNSVDATGLILPRKGSSSGLRTLFGTLLGHWRRPALKSLAYFAPHIAASWDARRLARRLGVPRRKRVHARLSRTMACRTGASPSTRTFLGAPPTPHSG
jgi:hypothetical protein